MNIKIFTAVFGFVATFSAAHATTTVSWWQFWTDPNIKPVIQEMVSEFEKDNPDIKVELADLTWSNGHEKIVMAFGSGTGPDIVELGSDWIAEFAANGLLRDISAEIESDSGDFQGWGMATYQGKIYARPWFLGTRIVFANRDLLNRAGYDSNFVPITLDDFRTAALKVQALGKEVYGWGSNTPEKHRLYKKFLPFFHSHGAQIFSDDKKYCVLSSDPAVAALTYYKVLHDSCGYVGSQREIEDAFLDGKVGFILSGDWLLKRIVLENRKINLVTAFVPGVSLPGRSFLGGEFLAVNAATKSTDAALRLVEFITSPENQVKFCKANHSANPSSVVAQKDEYFTSNIHLQTFIKQIKLAIYPPVDPDWVYIEQAIEDAIEEALFKNGGAGEALLKARKKIDKIKTK